MPRYTKRILDLPASLRPQEKFQAKGINSLTDEELVALILNTGTQKENAIQLAKRLLKKFPLSQLAEVSLDDIKDISGIGPMKFARLRAALALGERVYSTSAMTHIFIRSVEDILKNTQDIVHKKQEHLVVLYLNARQELIQKEIIAIGSVNVMGVELKDILAPAILSPCVSIVVVHNHPSGDPQPSDADITFTQKLHDAGKLMGIVLHDHVIVAERAYFSFAEEK